MDIQLFRAELKSLLEKYNASICFSVGSGSDTHGLYEEKIVVSVRPDPKSFKEIDVIEVDGWVMQAFDLGD